MNGTVLVTGAAGFVGYHTSQQLLREGFRVVGVDDLDGYYDPQLKRARLARLREHPRFKAWLVDLALRSSVDRVFRSATPSVVVHLAARPGVRASTVDPKGCVRNNVTAFVNVLEAARRGGVEHLVFASSSSVYGASRRLPYSEHDPVDHPVSLYAATKRSNELMAHAFAHVHGLSVTGLRFFTVYGPWGRPDMAYYRFAEAIRTGTPIRIYGDGSAIRDMTYVDDVVRGLLAVITAPAKQSESWNGHDPDPATSVDPFRLYNIGHGRPITVLQLVRLLEESLGRTTEVVHEAPQPGDVPATTADTSDLARLLTDTSTVPPEEGIERFAAWYADYHEMVPA